jgi:hypothetical protein
MQKMVETGAVSGPRWRKAMVILEMMERICTPDRFSIFLDLLVETMSAKRANFAKSATAGWEEKVELNHSSDKATCLARDSF